MNYYTVTQIISPYANFSGIRPSVLEAAAERGTAVHEACAAIALGLFPVMTDEIRPYIDSFMQWFNLMVEDTLLVEERLVDTSLGYSGQIDLLCHTSEGLILIDLKTPVAKAKGWRVQLAAYERLCLVNGYHPDKIGSLRLSREGKMARMDYYEGGPTDFKYFLEGLDLYRYFNS